MQHGFLLSFLFACSLAQQRRNRMQTTPRRCDRQSGVAPSCDILVALQVLAALLLPVAPQPDVGDGLAVRAAVAADDCVSVLVAALSGALAAHGSSTTQPQGASSSSAVI